MLRPKLRPTAICSGSPTTVDKASGRAFKLNDDRPLFAFAGIWTEFKGDRGTKSKPVPGPHNVYGFLTTEPNAMSNPSTPKLCR